MCFRLAQGCGKRRPEESGLGANSAHLGSTITITAVWWRPVFNIVPVCVFRLAQACRKGGTAVCRQPVSKAIPVCVFVLLSSVEKETQTKWFGKNNVHLKGKQ